MYLVNNVSEDFYLYSHKTQTHEYIGKEADLIRFLANGVSHTYSKHVSNWIFMYEDEQNLTMNDYSGHYPYNLYASEDYTFRKLYGGEYSIKPYTFFDGTYRIVDVKQFHQKVVSYLIEEQKRKPTYRYTTRTSRRQGRHRHRGVHYRRAPKLGTVRRFSYIPEYQKFVKAKERAYSLPQYWDDCTRLVSGSWKSQTKCRKQWEKNLSHKKTQ